MWNSLCTRAIACRAIVVLTQYLFSLLNDFVICLIHTNCVIGLCQVLRLGLQTSWWCRVGTPCNDYCFSILGLEIPEWLWFNLFVLQIVCKHEFSCSVMQSNLMQVPGCQYSGYLWWWCWHSLVHRYWWVASPAEASRKFKRWAMSRWWTTKQMRLSPHTQTSKLEINSTTGWLSTTSLIVDWPQERNRHASGCWASDGAVAHGCRRISVM